MLRRFLEESTEYAESSVGDARFSPAYSSPTEEESSSRQKSNQGLPGSGASRSSIRRHSCVNPPHLQLHCWRFVKKGGDWAQAARYSIPWSQHELEDKVRRYRIPIAGKLGLMKPARRMQITRLLDDCIKEEKDPGMTYEVVSVVDRDIKINGPKGRKDVTHMDVIIRRVVCA